MQILYVFSDNVSISGKSGYPTWPYKAPMLVVDQTRARPVFLTPFADLSETLPIDRSVCGSGGGPYRGGAKSELCSGGGRSFRPHFLGGPSLRLGARPAEQMTSDSFCHPWCTFLHGGWS